MDETTLQIISSLKILLVAGFATLYGFGGMSGKWLRRIIGPALLTAGIAGFSIWQDNFSYWYLACALSYWGALSLGYGGTDDTKKKILRRARVALALAAASLPLVIVNEAWLIFGIYAVMLQLVHVGFGVWNPFKSARAEETVIGATIALLPLFMF